MKADVKNKSIRKIIVTSISSHDSQLFPDLMDESDRVQATFADRAYAGQAKTLEKYG